jgi:hypothetical protein
MVAGMHSQMNPSGLEQYSLVERFVMHPQYDTVTLENDIVLIKVLSIEIHFRWDLIIIRKIVSQLATPFNLSSPVVKPVGLPLQMADTPVGTRTVVAGWGNLQVINLCEVPTFHRSKKYSNRRETQTGRTDSRK